MSETTELNGHRIGRLFRLPGNSRPARIIVLVAALAACTWTVHYWLANFHNILNDSACYIDAAENLVRSGRLVDYGKWLHFNGTHAAEPYTEWPPGTPLFLAPFILVFHDPMLSVIVAQTLLIVLVYAALLAFASALDMHSVLTVALLATFAFFHPFMFAVGQYASETLFFLTTLMAGFYAVKIVREGPAGKYWAMSLLFTFLASSVRFSGVANIGWYIPILGPGFALRRIARDPVTDMIRKIILGVGILALVGSIWADGLGMFVAQEIHLLHFALLILACCALMVGLGLVPVIEWKTVSGEKASQNGWTSRTNLLRFLVVVAAIGPVVLWFARNEIIYGMITRSHHLLGIFNVQGIAGLPQVLFFYMLQNPVIPQSISFLVLILLALMPLLTGRKKERVVGTVLVSAAFFQIATIWGSSILSRFADLDGRLLSPAILLAVLAALYGVGVLYKSNPNGRLRALLLILPFVFLATGEHADFKAPGLFSWRVEYPKEMYLWRQIHKMKWTMRSSAVYTEVNLRHQIFTGVPQEMYWNTDVLSDPVLLKDFFSKGRRPFFVFPESGRENRMIRATIRKHGIAVDSVVYPREGYVLYYEPPAGKSPDRLR